MELTRGSIAEAVSLQHGYDYILGSAIRKVARSAASSAGELHRNLTEDMGSKSQLGNQRRKKEVHANFFVQP